MENTPWFLLIVIIVSFYAGYKLVGFIITKFNDHSGRNNGDPGHKYEQQFSQNYQNSYQKRNADSFNVARKGNDPEEMHYAAVLGLQGNAGIEEIRMRYKELIAQYHPDTVRHLGKEFKDLAEVKTVEILEAYRYFQKRNRIT